MEGKSGRIRVSEIIINFDWRGICLDIANGRRLSDKRRW